MKFKQYFRTAFVIAISAVVVSSCVNKDEWETPPINCNNKFDTPNISMADFKTLAPAVGFVVISEDKIFDGYVVSSDENGNFYKTISFQDKPENPTVGLQMEVDRASNYADLPVGTHIRINAKGLRLGLDRGTVKIGSVDPNFTIGRIPGILFNKYISAVCNGNEMDIAIMVPTLVSSLADTKQEKYINTLVTVPNVQFDTSEISPFNKTYVDFIAGEGVDTSRTIEDMFGSSAELRNSGFSSYGSTLLPNGNGAITFVVSNYNGDYQMFVRGLNDVRFDKKRMVTEAETFESYAQGIDDFLPKYYNTSVTGSRKWFVQTYSNKKYLQISGLNMGPIKTHFAIPVDFSTKSKLSFKTNAGYYNGEVLKIYWSSDYDPANPSGALLNNITSQFDISKGEGGKAGSANYENDFRASGIGSYSSTGNGYIIFEYHSNSTSSIGASTVMQLDDINIF